VGAVVDLAIRGEPDFLPLAIGEIIFNAHVDHGADEGEGVADQPEAGQPTPHSEQSCRTDGTRGPTRKTQ
jgi:hypothetical protein